MLSKLKLLLAKEPSDSSVTKVTVSQLLSIKEMAKRLQAVFNERLEAFGFKAKGTAFVRQRLPIAWDKVSIQLLTYDKYEKNASCFRGNVYVGIRSDPVERLYSQISGVPGRQDQQTFNRYIGYVMPQKRHITWELPREYFPEKVARDMIETTIKYGLPFMEQFDNWQRIYDGTERYGDSSKMPDLRLPIIKYLMGQPDESVRLVENELVKIRNKTGAAEDLYRKKVAALIALCKKGETNKGQK